jgi:hypothetical protein
MNEFIASLKSDLLDRRLLPFLVLLALAFAGAVAYVVLGGGASSSSSSVPSAALGPAAAPPGGGPALPVSEAPPSPHAAVSETTEGARFQHRGGSHNPFTLLPGSGPAKEAAAAAAPSSSGAAESKTGASPSSGSGSGSTPPPAPKPKVAHKLVPTVSVLFGLVPTTPEQLSQLTPYASVKQKEILPASSNPLIVFLGVGPTRKTAIFTLARETIPKGPALCLPSATQCEAIELAPEQSEELSYLEPNGTVVTWDLVLKGVTMHQVAAARSARTSRAARAGAALLRRLELPIVSELHFDAARGVLRFVAPRRHHRSR